MFWSIANANEDVEENASRNIVIATITVLFNVFLSPFLLRGVVCQFQLKTFVELFSMPRFPEILKQERAFHVLNIYGAL